MISFQCVICHPILAVMQFLQFLREPWMLNNQRSTAQVPVYFCSARVGLWLLRKHSEILGWLWHFCSNAGTIASQQLNEGWVNSDKMCNSRKIQGGFMLCWSYGFIVADQELNFKSSLEWFRKIDVNIHVSGRMTLSNVWWFSHCAIGLDLFYWT